MNDYAERAARLLDGATNDPEYIAEAAALATLAIAQELKLANSKPDPTVKVGPFTAEPPIRTTTTSRVGDWFNDPTVPQWHLFNESRGTEERLRLRLNELEARGAHQRDTIARQARRGIDQARVNDLLRAEVADRLREDARKQAIIDSHKREIAGLKARLNELDDTRAIQLMELRANYRRRGEEVTAQRREIAALHQRAERLSRELLRATFSDKRGER